MRFDPANTALFDAIVSTYVNTHPGMPDRWILQQDLYTAPGRRALFSALMIEEGWAFLDAGCGFGVVPLDLVGQMGIQAHGLDADPAKIEVAGDLQAVLQTQGYPLAGNTVTFETGEVTATPYGDATFDFVLSGFVFQYLADPAAAAKELFRVVKPGGTLCLIDADDGLSLVHPEPSAAFSRLSEAFARRQELNGGDRSVGRKLASYLDAAGFEVASTLILPTAEYRATDPTDPGRRFMLDRFAEARAEIVEKGIMDAAEFDECLATFEKESAVVQYRTNAQLIAVGRKNG